MISKELQIGKFSSFRSFWGRPSRKTGVVGPAGVKKVHFYNGLHTKLSRPLPCMLCNALHAHYLFYSPKFFLCKGVLSKGFKYVPLQHTSSYRIQNLARDSADLILWALWSGMKLERVHLKMLQLPGFLCSVGLLCSLHLRRLQYPLFCAQCT